MLALAVAACGEESDTPSTSAPAAAERQKADEPTPEAPRAERERTAEDPRTAGEAAARDGDGSPDPESRSPAHDDSGGGTAQFRVPGGDNSVQDFGSEATESEFEQAAAALHGFLDARAAGDWEAVCEYVAGSVVDSLEQVASASAEMKGRKCPKLMAALSGSVPSAVRAEAAIADVGALRVEGEQAFLLYQGANYIDYAIPMTRDGGRWKVASLAGVPLS